MPRTKPSDIRIMKRRSRMRNYAHQTQPLLDAIPDGFGVITSGDLDPVEGIIRSDKRTKHKPRTERREEPTEDSYTGRYTTAPTPSRVQRTNEEPGSDRDGARQWQRREYERELDAATPLDDLFKAR